jgi:hypothetical protein
MRTTVTLLDSLLKKHFLKINYLIFFLFTILSVEKTFFKKEKQMKKFMLLVMLLILSITSFAVAQDPCQVAMGKNIFDVDVSQYMGEGAEVETGFGYYTKFKWHGINKFGDKSVNSTRVTYSLPPLGFIKDGVVLNVESFFPVGSGKEEATEIKYNLSYSGTMMPNTKTAVDYTISQTYYDKPKANRAADGQELGILCSLPNIATLFNQPIVPRVYISTLWDQKAAEGDSMTDGAYVEAGIGYLINNVRDMPPIELAVDVVYNDAGDDLPSGFTHGTVALSTEFAIDNGITAAPYVGYQLNFDKDRLNNEDSDLIAGVVIAIRM